MVKIKKKISFFLAAIFISYCANVTFFSHTHIIDGATIVHSHFHFASHHDTKSGGHTTLNITLIAQLSNFDYVDFLCSSDLTPLSLPHCESKCPETGCPAASVHFKNLSLRAPPAA